MATASSPLLLMVLPMTLGPQEAPRLWIPSAFPDSSTGILLAPMGSGHGVSVLFMYCMHSRWVRVLGIVS